MYQLHCPSLSVWLEGRASASLIQSLVLPNNLTGIFINACRPMSGSEFGNFSTYLCQSSSLEYMMWDDVDLNDMKRRNWLVLWSRLAH